LLRLVGLFVLCFLALQVLVCEMPIIADSQAASSRLIHQRFLGEVFYNPFAQDAWKPIRTGIVTIKISDVSDEIVVSGHDKKNRPC
jgi:hypothetical protein